MKLYHVFISSTFADLKDERKKVSEALAKAGYVPEGMELFPASSQKQFDFIKRVIDRCDYYVVIIGGRYGSISEDKVSYTEMEYNFALEKKIPTLAFLHKNPDRLEAGKVEKEKISLKRLNAFRERLKSSAMVDFWEDPGSLAASVVVAVGQEVNLNPGIGWVRGDQAIDPRLIEELSTARTRIHELETEVQAERKAEERVSFPTSLAPIDEKFAIELRLVEYNYADGKKNIISDEKHVTQASWKDIFLLSSLVTSDSDEEDDVYEKILKYLAKDGPKNPRRGQYRDISSPLKARQIRFQLEALGLVRAEIEMRDVPLPSYMSLDTLGKKKQPVTIWKFTEKGRQYMAEIWALKSNKNFVGD